MIHLNYHQAQAVAARAARVRDLARQSRGYGYTGTERIVLSYESPYNHPEQRGGLFMSIEGRHGAPVPLFAKDLGYERNFEAARMPGRDENGHVYHPDMEGIGFDEFDMGPQLRALGWLSATCSFESDADEAARDSYSESCSPDCSYWTPTPPDGEGWLLAAIYETEDGPVALYVRDSGDGPVHPPKVHERNRLSDAEEFGTPLAVAEVK
jgi:hypothetical protein